MTQLVFQYVGVYPQLLDQTVVRWELHRRFQVEGPWTFTVQMSRSGVDDADDWTTVTEVIESDRAVFSVNDVAQRGWSSHEIWFYRVKLTTADSSVYYSHAEPAWGSLPRVERIQAREIMRRELLRMIKTSAGTLGSLLKRRHWGITCPVCIDASTQESLDPNCDTCFGTKITGGYFSAEPYWLDFDAGVQKKTSQEDMGTTVSRAYRARGLAYPVPRSFDIWVSGENNRRYYVDQATVTGAMRGVPLILSIALHESPATDIAYRVPLE